jgi:hypothetical protein
MSFAWSYSRLKNFETCPKRHYHYDIAKDITEEESGALLEGHDTHKAFELRVSRKQKLPPNLARHESWIQMLVKPPGFAYAEQKLALNSFFEPVGFFADNVWFRCVLDFTKVMDSFAVVVDYKTGKVGDDDTQLSLQAATVFHTIPAINRVRSGMAFVNYDKVVSKVYHRSDIPLIWNKMLPRVKKYEAAMHHKEYPPTPSGLCVKYCGVVSCPYHGKGTR